MQVLVTGATGFLGMNLVRRLLSDGEDVRVLTRSLERARPLTGQGAQAVVGEMTDSSALGAAMQGVEVVYHLAGKLFTPGVPEREYYRTHVDGARALLACCQEQPSVERLVYVSTTGVLGVTGDQPADENAPCAPTNAYERSKWEAEQLVRETLGENTPTVIVRPGLVYGPGDRHMLGFFRAIQRGLFRPPGRRPVWLSVIYVDDMVEALLLCAKHPRAVGECFHIASPTPVTMASLSATIAMAMGKRPPAGTIPLAVARAAAAFGDFLPAKLKPLAPLTGTRLDFLTHSRVYNVSKAERLLGFVAETDLSVGISRAVDWYRQGGYLPKPTS
jgi:nucleoside-diphosphate-sugar epimerase